MVGPFGFRADEKRITRAVHDLYLGAFASMTSENLAISTMELGYKLLTRLTIISSCKLDGAENIQARQTDSSHSHLESWEVFLFPIIHASPG